MASVSCIKKIMNHLCESQFIIEKCFQLECNVDSSLSLTTDSVFLASPHRANKQTTHAASITIQLVLLHTTCFSYLFMKKKIKVFC